MIRTLRSNFANGTMGAQGDGSAAEKNFKKAGVFFGPATLPHWYHVDAPFWENPPAQPLQKRGLLNALGGLGHLLPAFVARWAGEKGNKSRNRRKGRFRADSGGKSGTRPDVEWVADLPGAPYPTPVWCKGAVLLQMHRMLRLHQEVKSA